MYCSSLFSSDPPLEEDDVPTGEWVCHRCKVAPKLDVSCCFFIYLNKFVLRLNIPVNNYSVMLGWSHGFLGITSTFGTQGPNTAEVGFEPLTSCSRV